MVLEKASAKKESAGKIKHLGVRKDVLIITSI